MSRDSKLTITSPEDRAKINCTNISVTISLSSGAAGGEKKEGYKYFRLLLDGKPVANYLHEADKSFSTYTFENIELSDQADNGNTAVFEARAYKGKSHSGKSIVSSPVNVIVDTMKPCISDISPAEGSYVINGKVPVRALIRDDGGSRLDHGSVKFLLDGSPVSPVIEPNPESSKSLEVVNLEYMPSAALADGPHSVSISASDQAGNESIPVTLSFIVDTTPPVIESIFPSGKVSKERLAEPVVIETYDKDSGIVSSSAWATLTAANGTIYTLKPANAENYGAGVKGKINFGPLPHIGLLGIGSHQMEIELADLAGNKISKTYSFEIADAIPFKNGLFQVFRNFTDSAGQTTPEPFLLPPDFSYGEDFHVEVGGVATGDTGFSSKVDTLEASVCKGTDKVVLKIPGDFLWNSKSESRLSLKENFEKLLEEFELKEGTNLKYGAADLIRSRAVRSLPLAISEVLIWSTGIDPFTRGVPLRPGFRLRVTGASFQYCGPGRDEINGMVPSGEMLLPVSRQRLKNGSFITSLNPMATVFWEEGYTTSTEPEDGMIGGPDDLHAGDLKRKHLAVVLPATLSSSATASAVDEEHAALVAADNSSALVAGIRHAAGEYNDSAGQYVIRRFRGRTGVVVEIPVIINGKKSFVPIGSTLRQICEEHLHWFSPDMVVQGRVKWLRQWSDLNGAGDTIKVKSTVWSDLGLAPSDLHTDISDAPLLPGDQVEFTMGS
ncbi:MAG: hypothetical protein OEV42_06670 [Deltaproteobacteria bacterium]|nr:hypothetical protein [Deltaproteobacteria bacterium]